jgi:hypothetical protein
MRRSIARLLICSHLLILPLGCSRSPVQGRYQRGAAWIEFRPDGSVMHGETRDVAQYRVEDAQIVITSPEGTTTGRIVNPATVEFPPGTNAVAEAFGGVWVFRPVGAVVELGGVQARAAAAALVGAWRIRGEADVLDFQADGTYTWGRLSGTYKMLDALRVRMTMDEDGKRIGQLDNGFVVDGDELRLTAPDGAVTVYERVR